VAEPPLTRRRASLAARRRLCANYAAPVRSRLLRRLAGAAITLKSWGVIGLIVVRASGYRGRSWRWSQVFPFSTYLLPASIVLAAIAAARRRWSTAATLLGGAAVITRVLLPRTRPVAQPAIAEPRRLRVMSTNLLLGSADAEGIVALVREYDPAVLALQELSAGLITRLGQAGLFELLPHHVLRAGGRRQDTGLASRYPLPPVNFTARFVRSKFESVALAAPIVQAGCAVRSARPQ